jgi:hypothetical protein
MFLFHGVGKQDDIARRNCHAFAWTLPKTCTVRNLAGDAPGRCRPAEVVKVNKTVVSGMPDIDRLSTSHVERQNHTLRTHFRRLTRLANAFSKKFENFQAAVALNFCYYNFVKTHGAIRMTPAQAAGVENSAWLSRNW